MIYFLLLLWFVVAVISLLFYYFIHHISLFLVHSDRAVELVGKKEESIERNRDTKNSLLSQLIIENVNINMNMDMNMNMNMNMNTNRNRNRNTNRNRNIDERNNTSNYHDLQYPPLSYDSFAFAPYYISCRLPKGV